jgi:putative ABC transport system permease protein
MNADKSILLDPRLPAFIGGPDISRLLTGGPAGAKAAGAEPRSIRNMVVFQALRLTAAGVVIGLAAAFGLTRLIASLLYGVKAWDPMVFSAVPIVLIGVALISVWLPAMRASRVDPIQALRYE